VRIRELFTVQVVWRSTSK